jgi:response regulator NasT|tara:strand:+ start:938 stop:1522 length:585 start_codon:yes stop_codon:yes gene_type:complete
LKTIKTTRLLIADDQSFSRDALKDALIEKGFDIAGEAATGKEAIKLNKKLKPDLIFMDVKMPELNGIEASHEINSKNPVPIILLTVKDDRSTIERAKSAGVMAYLVKPFNKKELVPNIEIAIKRFHEFKKVKNENADLKAKLNARKLIEKAKGILMEKHNINEQEAFRMVQKAAMDKHTSMKEIAESIIMTADL